MDAPAARISLTRTQRTSQIGAELLSLCQTVTADGSLNDEEVSSLREWLTAHAASDLPAIRFLAPIVERILADGVVNTAERRELYLAVEKVLPPDARGLARAARMASEWTERQERTEAAKLSKDEERAERERNRPIEHFDFMIAGAKYEGRPAIIKRHVRVPDEVQLARDPDNRYSRNAVKVVTASGRHIGFVPEEHASDLAPLLDKAHPYVAKIKKVLIGSTHPIPVVVADLFRHDAKVERSTRDAEPRAKPSGLAIVLWALAVIAVLLMALRGCS